MIVTTVENVTGFMNTTVNLSDFNILSDSEDGSVKLEAIFITIVFVVVALFICTGNIVVIIAIHRTPELQTNTNAFVSNLAVADFIIGLQILLVRLIYGFRNMWLNTYFFCYARSFVTVLTINASETHLVGMCCTLNIQCQIQKSL